MNEPPISPARSALMARVRQKGTEPELAVRRCLHRMGYRFRLHRTGLPGTPDIVLPKHRKAIFVHGCFWHRHPRCARTTTPKTRIAFWTEKFRSNQHRDRVNMLHLRKTGWDPVVVWECRALDTATLEMHLEA
jgi:DNA mismatch endonuclease (patch repair protein)